MKFTETQKKWALLASLSSVLSFNLVLSLSQPGMASDTWSSRYPAEDLAHSYGEIEVAGQKKKVMFERDGEKTIAMIADEVNCYLCGKKINLPIQFGKNIDELKGALAVALASDKKEEEKSPSKAASRKEREKLKNIAKEEADADADVDEGKAALEKLRKDCRNNTFYKKPNDKLECFSDGLVHVLQNEDIEFKKSDVFKLYVDNIAKPLMTLFKSAQGSENYELAKSIVNDLATSIPEEYNYLREAVAKVNARVVADAEREVQAKFAAYKQADQLAKANMSNPALRQHANLIGESVDKMQLQTEKMANDLGVNLHNGFADAVSNGQLSANLADQYFKVDYLGNVNTIIQGLKQSSLSYLAGNTNASNYQIPVIDIGDGSLISLNDGTTLLVTGGSLISGASAGVGPSRTANLTAVNGFTLRPNNLTAQDVIIPGTTPMIQAGQAGQNTARFVVIQGGQVSGQRQMVPSRTIPATGAPRIQ